MSKAKKLAYYQHKYKKITISGLNTYEAYAYTQCLC